MWLCKNSSQLVCSYGEAACNWPNPGSPQIARLCGVRMGLVERESECTVVSGEGTSKEFTSYLGFSLLLLWVCFALLQQELKSLVFLFSLLVLE